MYPYFDVAHYILMCISVKDDLGPTATSFSRRHPFSCWLSCMLTSFAGSFLSCFLLGEPVITPFKNHRDIVLATAVWYAVFYSPFDVVCRLSKFFPVKIVLSVIKEVQRTHKISHGVNYTAKIYPESYLVQLLVGVSKGAGSGVVKIVEKLIRGSWAPMQHELLYPTFTTKACLVASIVFVLEKNRMYVMAPHELVYLSVIGFFVYFKLSALVLGVTDPLAPVENVCCAILMGGVWDALNRAVTTTKEELSTRKPTEEEIIQGKKSRLETKKTK